MPLRVNCQCGVALNVPDTMAGKGVKCPKCQSVIAVAPSSNAAAAATAPAKPTASKPAVAAKPAATKPAAAKPTAAASQEAQKGSIAGAKARGEIIASGRLGNTVDNLVADFRLNKRIKAQTDAFIRGFHEVIPLQWL